MKLRNHYAKVAQQEISVADSVIFVTGLRRGKMLAIKWEHAVERHCYYSVPMSYKLFRYFDSTEKPKQSWCIFSLYVLTIGISPGGDISPLQ